MVYSRMQNQFAVWLGLILAATAGLLAAYRMVGAVGDIFSLGVSTETVSILLLISGIALVGLSTAVATLLFVLFPSPAKRSPHWFLVALCIGIVMSIAGFLGVFR